VANVHREPTEVKTERNESRGLVLVVHLDEDSMAEVDNAPIAGTSLALLRAAILVERCKPDVSKSIRQGTN
jgi:hypothetical protein